MSITRFNKSELVFTNNERFEEFKTLEELFQENGKEQEYDVLGVYTFNSNFGDGAFIKSNGFNITLPKHLVNTIKEIREDKECVDEINTGKVTINIYSYTLPDKYGDKVFYSINFVSKEI